MVVRVFSRRVSLYSRLFVGLLAFVLLIFLSGTDEVLNTLYSVKPFPFAIFMFISVLLILVSILKWRVLLRFFGGSATLSELFALYLMGYFINTFFPSQIGGDAVRSWSLGKRVGQRIAFSATILERATGFFMMVMLGVFGLAFAPNVPFNVVVIYSGIVASLVALVAIMLWEDGSKTILNVLPLGRFRDKMTSLRHSLVLGISEKRVLLKTLSLSLLFHVVAVFNTIYAGYLVGWYNVSLFDVFMVLPLILILGSLPLTPNGLGVQEGAFYFFLQTIGATPAQSIAVALVLRLKVIILALMGGVVWLLRWHDVN
jgi:hypothetical protein